MRVVLANGTSVDLGKVEITPTIGITDYSRRVTDDFGVTTVVPRKFSRRMSMRLAVPNARADEVYNQLVALRAKTATFIADDRYAWLQAEGRIKEFEFAYQTGDQTYYTLSIDGIAETEGVTDTGVDPSASGKPSAFKLVQPVSVTDAVLTSSSVMEGDVPAWSASATYAKGATVTRAHRVFESLTDGNDGADPTADAAKWLDTGPTNRWAMFDEALGTSTIASAVVEVVLKTVNAISALALLDTNAASVRVRAPGYDRTVVPNGAGQAIFLDLAVAASANITVTVVPAAVSPGPQYWDDGAQWMDAGVWSDSLAAGDGTVTIGTFLFGELKGLGTTETGVTAGITDYSRKDTDEFGDVTIVERGWSKRMAAKTLIRSDAVDVVADRLAGVRARPSLWIARTNTDSLTIYGYPKDWSIEVGLNTSKLSLSVEGLSRAAPARTGGLGGPVDWTDVTDKTGTKPTDNADKTSENTSKDTAAVGGKAALEITAELEELANGRVATDEALQALGRAGVDRVAAERLLTRGGDMLAEAALRLTLDASRRAVAIRDAGIVIDPVTGKARLYAVEEALGRSAQAEITLDAQAASIRNRVTYADFERGIAEAQLEGKDIDLSGLYDRVSEAEVEIDGIAGEIALRATTAELSALGLTVSEIEETLDSLGDVVGVTTDVRLVRRTTDQAARAILGGLVSQDRASRGGQTAIVQARQELTARMDERDTIEARSRTQLGVALGDVEARLVAESRARIAAGVVTAESIDALGVTTDEQAAAIADLSTASVDQAGGLTVVRTTQRQQAALDDQTAEALLASLIAGDRSDRRSRTQLAQVQAEQTTELVREKLSRAAERVALDARLGASEATAARSAEALAEADRAAARTVELLQAEIDDPNTGLTAAHASIGKVEEVVVGPAGASARAVTVLDVNGRVTGTVNTNDGTTGAFSVVADMFDVRHPTTGALLFYVDVDGAIAASFKPSAIGYDNLQMGAAQKAAFFSIPADISVARGATVQIVSVTFTKEDSDSILEVQMFANVSSPDDLQFTGTIQVDGTTVQSAGVNIVLDNPNSAGRMPITPFAFVPGIAAGQRTVSFVLTNNETDNVALSVLAGSTLKVVELRKGSIGSVTGSGAPVVTPGTGGGGGSGGGGYNGGGRPPVVQQ